jgi:hypothetical protein
MPTFDLRTTNENEILSFWRTSTRLDRACASVDEVEEIAPDMFLVRSQSKPSKRYLVDYRAKTCECPDFVYRGSVNGIVCKHWMSVHLAKFRKPGADSQ